MTRAAAPARRHQRPGGRLAPLLLAAALGGCAVGDDYRRPPVDAPAAYRGTAAPGPSLAASDWRTVFIDPAQQSLIEQALAGTNQCDTEYRVQLPDGTVRWLTSVGRMERGVSGKPKDAARRC